MRISPPRQELSNSSRELPQISERKSQSANYTPLLQAPLTTSTPLALTKLMHYKVCLFILFNNIISDEEFDWMDGCVWNHQSKANYVCGVWKLVLSISSICRALLTVTVHSILNFSMANWSGTYAINDPESKSHHSETVQDQALT